MINFNVVLFEGFEILDAFGPVEMIGGLPDLYELKYFSQNGGPAASSQHAEVNTLSFSQMRGDGILLIPGGLGTRKLVDDAGFIVEIKTLAEKSRFVLSVCTGAAILAKTGLLDDKAATTNKQAFQWVASQNENVRWVERARWVVAGKYYTSSGVSAGTDMVLGFIAAQHGMETVQKICDDTEYVWNSDPNNDPFAIG